MATPYANYSPRVWTSDDNSTMIWEHQYQRNTAALIVAAALIEAVTRFTEYSVERLLLSNFPSISKQYCFPTGTEDTTKLRRTQVQLTALTCAVAVFGRWPLGMIIPIHLCDSVFFATMLLVVVELSFVALLSLMVGFIRIAHRTALVTGWEHPDSPVRAFSPLDYSKKHLHLGTPAVLEDSSTCASDENDMSVNGSPVHDTSLALIDTSSKLVDTSLKLDDASPKLVDVTDSFMRFSPAALSSTTWLKTRSFTNSIFSNSTQSTSSFDSFGGPSIGRSSSLHRVQNASDLGAVPDLLTGTPRRRFA